MALPLERYNEPSGPDKFAELAGAKGVDMRGMTKMQAADKWFDEIERLLADLNIKTGHLNEQFGLQNEDLEHIVRRQYENDFAMEINPIDFVFEDCIKLLEDLL
jgi:alcohol dehydrogenase class IV